MNPAIFIVPRLIGLRPLESAVTRAITLPRRLNQDAKWSRKRVARGFTLFLPSIFTVT